MADVIRCSLTGTLANGEVWSVNPVYKITTGAVITSVELTAAVAAVNAVSPSVAMRGLWDSAVSLTGCRIEARRHDGTLEGLAEGQRTTAVSGNSPEILPLQSAMVISLNSVAGGARGRGRLYWPACGAVLVGGTHRLLASTVTTLLTDVKTYLQAVGAAIDGAVDETVALAVWSRASASSSLVNRIKIGDILDTQRRRRDAIPETYQQIDYT